MADQNHLNILKKGVLVWNSWRGENPDIRPNLIDVYLPGENLSGANLGGVDFGAANLCGANLSNSNLVSAIFRGTENKRANLNGANLGMSVLNYTHILSADLIGVNFTNAILTHARLNNPNLTDADLFGARLSSTIFLDAEFKDTSFKKSEIGSTVFGNCDLSEAIALEAVKHIGPSFIGIDTIYRSKGQIPDIFLRGVGIPDNFIAYLASLVGKPFEFYSCFISYGHADKSFARRLHDSLQGVGIRCWLDEHQLLPGDNIYLEVDRGIRLWDKVLLCCSKDSLTSWWVDNEINTALSKEQGLWKERGMEVRVLIPLNLDGFIFSKAWESGKAEQIKSRLAADFTGWHQDNEKFDKQLKRLVRALMSDGRGRELPPEPKL